MQLDRIAGGLAYLHERFVQRGVWHALAYGTLLGAVRDGDLIPWDYDFDLLIQPRDVGRILAMSAQTAADGIVFEPVTAGAHALAVNPADLAGISASAIGVWCDAGKIADLYVFTLFRDGVLRRFDLDSDGYWVPHSSFAHYFLETLETATIRGVPYPIPRHAARLLADTYGADWQTPYRAVRQGGQARQGATVHGDRYEPHLPDQIAWCDAQGWDRSQYVHERAWPRAIRAAGPIGPTDRTRGGSNALWWRSRAELSSRY